MRRAMADKSGPTSESLSQQYRARAEECRTRAQAFRDPKARARMLDVAAEYERKAKQAEASEIQKPQDK
jgi:hypothetical protein